MLHRISFLEVYEMAKVTDYHTDSPEYPLSHREAYREQRGRDNPARMLIALALLGGLSFHSRSAFGWAGPGHMQVAAIAFDQLDPAVKKKVATLLKKNPNYKDWVKGVPKKDVPEIAFVTAATWPDFIKGHGQGYADDGDHPQNVPASSQNAGYTDKLMHKYWHYIDIPFSPDGTATHPPDFVNAQTQIALFRAALKANKTKAEIKSYDLVWLLHLVGDMHQPLHCTSRYDKDQPDGDSGGNSVKICEGSQCNEKLHMLWDDFPGSSSSAADAITAAKAIKPADPALVAIQDEAAWVRESSDDAKADVYTAPIGVGGGPFPVTPEYLQRGKALANERIALAGARLAQLLNDALK